MDEAANSPGPPSAVDPPKPKSVAGPPNLGAILSIPVTVQVVLGSTALMRQAVAQATHHAAHRFAFGGRLAEQPLMRNVLADLAVESEAATTLALRLAAAFDAPERDFRRLAVAEQLSDPAKSRGLVERDVTRVVTPGTVVEPGLLDDRRANYIAALVTDGARAGLAHADVSTGRFLTTQLAATGVAAELLRLGPAELLAS